MSDKNIISNLRRIFNFGSNIRNICILNNTNDILDCIKDSVKYFPINVSYEWRVNLLKELLSIKHNPHHLEGFSFEEIEILIENLACS